MKWRNLIMILLTVEGWLNGISASMIVLSGFAIGMFCIYTSIKTNAKLLFYVGFVIFGICFPWLGEFIDFLSILVTGNNLDNSYGLHGLINFVWIPIASLSIIYVVVELIQLKKKWYILSVFIVVFIIYEIILFLNPLGPFNYIYPDTPGEDLIDNPIALDSPLSILTVFFFLSNLCGVLVALFKGIQSEGIIKKKFKLLAIGGFIILGFSIIDGFFSNLEYFLFITRIGVVFGCLIMYWALREEKEEKVKITKEIKVKGDLFRISKYRRENITEEEISISKEKKICLVCKGKVGGFSFICNECGAFYCDKCAKAMIDLENMCWVCNTLIDPSKPSKPYEKEVSDIDSKILEKGEKEFKK